MNIRSIVLLGFIKKASQYLQNDFEGNNQVEDLEKLKNLKLELLEQELVANAEMAFSDAEISVDELLKTGGDAFDDFIKNKNDSTEVIGELKDIFDESEAPKEKNKIKDDLNELLSFYEPIPTEKFVDDDDEYLKLISEAAGNVQTEAPVKEEVEEEPPKDEDLDDIFSEILGNEKTEEESKEKTTEDKIPGNDEYLQNLVNELRNQLEEEKNKQNRSAERLSVFEKISNMYPYLTGGFIRAVYSLKEGIAKENPLGKRIVILHRVYFKDVESLRQFVEIVSNHDYTVNVDESKLVVDVFKEHINADGKILTNIFEIANQARVLDGDYDGYRIVKRDN